MLRPFLRIASPAISDFIEFFINQKRWFMLSMLTSFGPISMVTGWCW